MAAHETAEDAHAHAGARQSPSQTESDLAESNERYRSLFAYSPLAVFSVDLTGTFTDANEVAQQLSGYSLAELELMDFNHLIVSEDQQRATKAYQGALESEAQQLEAVICTKGGRRLELNLAAAPVIVGGRVVGVHGTAEDVTERNELRRALERQRRRAEEANAAKSLFVAQMSHEVRTPLTSVLGATELLAEGELGAEQRQLLEMIHRSGEKLLRLVNDVLDVSRLEAGRMVLERTSFSLRGLVDDAVAWTMPFAAERGIDFTWSVDAAVPLQASGDTMRIMQVLTNLLGNALRYTERGQVRLRVEMASAQPPQVCFVIEDSGIGISEDELDTTFESFTQADTSTPRKYSGADLGLAISQELVTLMGGAISAIGAPGRGSSFTFTLPWGADSAR